MNEKCKFHLGGSASPCGGKACKTCIPYLLFKATVILLAGILMGAAGLMLVEGNPAAELLRDSATWNDQRATILEKLSNIDSTVVEIKDDVVNIKRKIGMDN